METPYTWTGLNDNVGPYVFTISAENAAGVGPSTQSSPVFAHKIPTTPQPPTAKATGSLCTCSQTTVDVSWPAVMLCNDAQPCLSYIVTVWRKLNGTSTATPQAESGSCPGAPAICSAAFTVPNDGSMYAYTMQDVNHEKQTSLASGESAPAVNAVGRPDAITNLNITDDNQASFTLQASNDPASTSIPSVTYQVRSEATGVVQTASWPNPPGPNVTETISPSLLGPGDAYLVTVEECNDAGGCGVPSTASSAYGPPTAPSMELPSQTGDSITFTWTGGGDGNGQNINHYVVCISTASPPQNCNPTANTSDTNTYPCGVTEYAGVSVVDAEQQPSPEFKHRFSANTNVRTDKTDQDHPGDVISRLD